VMVRQCVGHWPFLELGPAFLPVGVIFLAIDPN